MPGIVEMNTDGKLTLISMMEGLWVVRKQLFKIAFESKNSGVQVRALKTLTDSLCDEIEMLQSLGLLPCVSTRI